MKRLIALLVVCMLCLTTAYAAEWKEGLSAAKPYSGVPEVNLNELMGYIMLYPRTKLPAVLYCDVLEIYLPRDDVALGEGKLTLYDENGEVVAIDFTDEEAVELRQLEESELEGLMWGSGVCVEVHLPTSLRFDGSYYVLMDQGCYTAADGKVLSDPIPENDYWTPVVQGDFGVSNLFYSAPVEVEEGEEVPEDAVGEIKRTPEVGDIITFDLIMGGDAATAVVYSDTGSAEFEQAEYTESATVKGVVTGDPLSWGVVFLDANGEMIKISDTQYAVVEMGQ